MGGPCGSGRAREEAGTGDLTWTGKLFFFIPAKARIHNVFRLPLAVAALSSELALGCSWRKRLNGRQGMYT